MRMIGRTIAILALVLIPAVAPVRTVVPTVILHDAHVHVGPWPDMRDLGLSGTDDPSWEAALDSVRAATAVAPRGWWISGENVFRSGEADVDR